MSDAATPINITSQPIELCKLLKIANMVSGGGEAKIVISEGYVAVNNQVEFQKRKKIYENDIVEFNGDSIQVMCSDVSKSSKTNINTAIKIMSKTSTINPSEKRDDSQPLPRKRKPISF